jgi:hypothetical protein
MTVYACHARQYAAMIYDLPNFIYPKRELKALRSRNVTGENVFPYARRATKRFVRL